MIKELEKKGLDVCSAIALGGAAAQGHFPVVEYLLEKGADPNVVTNIIYTKDCPLICAVERGVRECVKAILEKSKGSLDYINDRNETALIISCKIGTEEIVQDLLEAGAKVDLIDKRGMTALHWAAKNGNEGIISSLLECGAKANMKDEEGRTAKAIAKEQNHQDCVEILEGYTE